MFHRVDIHFECRYSVKVSFMDFRFIIPATVPVHLIAPEPHNQGIGDLNYILSSKVLSAVPILVILQNIHPFHEDDSSFQIHEMKTRTLETEPE